MRALPAGTLLPRAGIVRMDPAWVQAVGKPTPWEREAAAGELEVPAPSERPSNIVNVADVDGEYDGRWKRVGAAAGSELTGLNYATLYAGESGADPHCHSAEEEIFVVLEGGGTLELIPSPVRRDQGAQEEQHELRAGHVISRPPRTAIAHFIQAGDEGMTYLAYGTREPSDIAYYPRSNELAFRGVGLVARLEHVPSEE